MMDLSMLDVLGPTDGGDGFRAWRIGNWNLWIDVVRGVPSPTGQRWRDGDAVKTTVGVGTLAEVEGQIAAMAKTDVVDHHRHHSFKVPPWAEPIEVARAEWERRGVAMFLGFPDAWIDAHRVRCEKEHVSTRTLKQGATGNNVCLECYGQTWPTFPTDRDGPWDAAAAVKVFTDADRCTCPKVCDCQAPDASPASPALVSNECPTHNLEPKPAPDCPVHAI